MTNVDRAIQSKKDALSRRKKGAVISSEPKVFQVKMIERVGGEYNKVLTVRYRFNAALKDQLANRENHFILDVGKVIAEHNLFTIRNRLIDQGMHIFWWKIDELIEDFEYDRDKFKPIRQIQFDCKGQTNKKKQSTRCSSNGDRKMQPTYNF